MNTPKILIVDDRLENLISLEMILSDFSVEFVRAFSGEEALRKTLKEDFAMAILDVQMPGMDGYETLSLMRNRHKTRYLPVIFVSAIHQSDVHIIRGIETGAIDFIPKPIIPEILVGKVRVFLDLYKQKQELFQMMMTLGEKNRELTIQREKAEKATDAKSFYLAYMSHEIRTPLSGILGVSRVLEKTSLDAEQKKLLQTVISSGEHVISIINDILDYSKIESGQVALEKIPFDLREVVGSVCGLLVHNAHEKNIRLEVSVDEALPSSLIGDPLRINQIVTNLVNNAIKFTDQGGVTIRVSVPEYRENQVRVKISVTDTGIGISDEGKKKLFKEYSQTELSTSRKYGGTGLGLAICKNLVSLMEGEIGVNSQAGEGAEFWVEVPLCCAAPAETAEELPDPGGIKILLAEDNKVNQLVISHLLKNMELDCDIANNGKEAFEMFREKSYDLILMDMQMPEMDGLEATGKIREYEQDNPCRKAIYIVAVTANVFEEERKKCLEAGMNDFLSKPFKESEIKKVISHAARS